MTDKITPIGVKQIKPASMPDMINRMEKADYTIVIHVEKGQWTLQHMKGTNTVWQLIGILQMVTSHFCNLANGKS